MTIQLTTFLLYSRQDKHWQKRIRPYLQALKSLDFAQPVRYIAIENLSEFKLLEHIERTDVVMVLQSMALLQAEAWGVTARRKLQKYHHWDRLTAVRIPLHEVVADADFLSSLPSAPVNGHPVSSPFWRTPEKAYLQIHKELVGHFEHRKVRKAKLERCWQEVDQLDEIVWYDKFLEAFPHSKYSQLARQRQNELVENRLWLDAKFKHKKDGEEIPGDTVAGYLEYMRYAPLKVYWDEAIECIAHLEKDADKNWEQAKSLHHIIPYLQFKNHFQKHESISEANKYIDTALHKKTIIKPISGSAMNVTHLFFTMLDELNAKEVLNVVTALDALTKVQQTLKQTNKRLYSMQQSLWAFGLLLLLATMFFSLLQAPTGVVQAGINLPKLSILLLPFALRYGFSYFLIQHDRNRIQEALESSKYLHVDIQASIILHEQEYYKQILQFFRKAEKGMKHIRKKTIWDYISKWPNFEEEQSMTWQPPYGKKEDA